MPLPFARTLVLGGTGEQTSKYLVSPRWGVFTFFTNWYCRIPGVIGFATNLTAAPQSESILTPDGHTVIVDIRGFLARYLVPIGHVGAGALNVREGKHTERSGATPDAPVLLVTCTTDGALPNEGEFYPFLWPGVTRVSDSGSIDNGC